MELIKTTKNPIVVAGKIDFSIGEIKKEVASLLEKKDVIITSDSLKETKKEMADLNKLATHLDDIRKKVKKEYLKPLADFEDEIKEIVSQIKDTRAGLDSQVKKFESEKKEEIKEIIKSFVDDLYVLNSIPEEYHMLDPDKYVKLSAVSASGKVTKATATAIEGDVAKILLEIEKDKQKKLEEQVKLQQIKSEAVLEFIQNNKASEPKPEEAKDEPADSKGLVEIVYKVKAPIDMPDEEVYEKVKDLIVAGKIKHEVRRV